MNRQINHLVSNVAIVVGAALSLLVGAPGCSAAADDAAREEAPGDTSQAVTAVPVAGTPMCSDLPFSFTVEGVAGRRYQLLLGPTFEASATTWPMAVELSKNRYCMDGDRMLIGHLVTPTSQTEDVGVRKAILEQSKKAGYYWSDAFHYWIGIDGAEDGSLAPNAAWRWRTGEVYTYPFFGLDGKRSYSPWGQGEPDSKGHYGGAFLEIQEFSSTLRVISGTAPGSLTGTYWGTEGEAPHATVFTVLEFERGGVVANADSTTMPAETARMSIRVLDNDVPLIASINPTSIRVATGTNAPIQYSITTAAGGKATAVRDGEDVGTVTYERPPSFVGTDTFAYKVCTENSACAWSTVTVVLQ